MSVFKREKVSFGSTGVQTSRAPAAEPAYQAVEEPATPPAKTTAAPSEPPKPAAPSLARDAAAIIDKNSQLTGTLHSKGNILVEGVFSGEIEAQEAVLVDREAQAEGRLQANDVIISGSFDGEVSCQHRLHITSTATVKGEIKTPVLVVEEGATINCRFEMTRAGR